jgi:hypothetical protein
MKSRSLLFLLIGLLPALLAAATAAPTEKMFTGQVASLAADGRSLQERSAAACHKFAKEMDGAGFFTAWAFPVCERIHSGQRHRTGSESGLMSVKSRDGRIVVNSDGDHSLNISDGPGAKKDDAAWGVLIFLHQVENGRCRISDVQLLAPDRIYDLGGERLAWLGAADETRGLEFIRSLLFAGDPGRELRKDLVFALYLFDGPAAAADLIGLARRDPDMEIRKDAIFWLGQKASVAAVAALGEVIAAPEELEIKKAAVFALSQLPAEKGTPLLLGIARRHPQPRVRKEAIFWLGQSGDPKALDFFEEILLK